MIREYSILIIGSLLLVCAILIMMHILVRNKLQNDIKVYEVFKKKREEKLTNVMMEISKLNQLLGERTTQRDNLVDKIHNISDDLENNLVAVHNGKVYTTYGVGQQSGLYIYVKENKKNVRKPAVFAIKSDDNSPQTLKEYLGTVAYY